MMQQPAAAVSVLVVDDHRVFAEVLAMRLRADPTIADVEVAFSLPDARALINAMQPDLVLLDFHLSDESGVKLLDDPAGLVKRPDVIIVSARSDPASIIAALEAGALGWVTKDAEFEVLIAAIEQVRSGQIYLPGFLARPVIRQLLDDARARHREPDFVSQISPRELEVLRCLVSGMTRAEVATHLFVSPNTVRTHIHKLLRTAGEHSTLALVAAARRSGVTGVDEMPEPALPLQRSWSN
jgi:DNA-binding NarL/FixJ family response regulator